MATIRIKRGNGDPNGTTNLLNAGELAANVSTPKLFIKTVTDNTTAPVWIGAQIENSPGNWTNTDKLATQNAINTTFMPKSGGTFTGPVSIGQGTTAPGELRLLEDADFGANYSAFRGSTRSANITYVMPTIDPTAGQVLTASAPSAGVSNLSWEAAPAPSAVSTTNDNTNTTRYLVFSTTNGSSAPLYVDDSTTPLTYNPSTSVLSLSGSGGTLSAANLTSPGNIVNLFTGKVTASDTLNFFTYAPTGGDIKTLNIGSSTAASHDGATVINIGAGEPSTMSGSYNINIGNTKATTTIVNATVAGLTATGNTLLANTTITGDLTVNGTTFTLNSTVTTIDDPVLVLGGDSAVADTVKDRGIEFRYGGATVTITNYIGNGTTTVTGTVASTTGWQAGDVITISGATGTEQVKLNGTWRIASIATGTTFTFVVNTSVAAGTYTTNLGTTVRVLNGFMGYDQSEARFVLRERANNDGSDTFSGTDMGSLEIKNLRLAGNVIQDNGGTTRITFDSGGTVFSGGGGPGGIKINGDSITSSTAQVMTFSGANLTAKGTLTVEGGSISTGAAVASTLFSTTTTANVGIATGLTTGTFTIGATGSTGAVSLFPATGTQAITLGGSTTGTITIGGTGSPVNIATGASTGTVQIGSTSASAQTVNIATTTSGTTSIGGTGAVTLGAAAGSGTINIGNTGTAQAQAVNIATATTGTITIGGTGATAVILPTGKTRVGQTTLIQGGAVNITLPTAGGTLVGSGDTALPSNITGSSLTSVGTLTGLTVTGASTNVVSLTTGSTGTMTLDTGTTGQINIGTNANAKTITVGNGTGATSLVLNCGTGALNIGTNAVARTVTVGNGTGATSLVLDCGTGALNVGANAVARTVTVGNTTGASVLNLNAGTGGVAITTGTTGTVGIDSGTTGAINIGTNTNAKTITVGNGTGATSLVLNCGTGALNIGTNAVARTVTVGNTTGASALVLNAGTGAITMGAPVIYNTANITASGTNQSGAAGLTADLNFVTLGTGGVALPAATAGRKITVVNRTSASIIVYPVNAGDDTIDGAAANAGYTLQPSEYGEFDCSSATAWFTNGTLDGGTY